MIALWIIWGILVFIILILLMPINVFIRFKEEFFLKVKLSGFKVFEIEPEVKKENASSDTVSDKTAKEDTENTAKKIFLKLKNRYGFSNAVKVILEFCKQCLTHIKKLLRHIKVKRIVFDLTVAAEDAAATAIEYGAVCGVAYPVLSLIESCANVKYRNINIRSDFTSNNPQFQFSAVIKCRIIFLIIAAFKVFTEYNKFKEREEL